MARTRSRDINIIIDGIPVADLMSTELSRDTYDIGPFISELSYKVSSPTMRIQIQTIHNTELSFDIHSGDFIQTEDAIFIYGPLRKLFPSIFADKDLLDWQLEYLCEFDYPKHSKYQYYRDDPLFESPQAIGFYRGFMYFKKNKELEYNKGKEVGIRIGKAEAYQEVTKRKRTKKWNNNF